MSPGASPTQQNHCALPGKVAGGKNDKVGGGGLWCRSVWWGGGWSNGDSPRPNGAADLKAVGGRRRLAPCNKHAQFVRAHRGTYYFTHNPPLPARPLSLPPPLYSSPTLPPYPPPTPTWVVILLTCNYPNTFSLGVKRAAFPPRPLSSRLLVAICLSLGRSAPYQPTHRTNPICHWARHWQGLLGVWGV